MGKMKEIYEEMEREEARKREGEDKLKVVVYSSDDTVLLSIDNIQNLMIGAGEWDDNNYHQFLHGSRNDIKIMLNHVEQRVSNPMDALKALLGLDHGPKDDLAKGLMKDLITAMRHDCDNCPAYDICDLDMKKPR